MLRSVALLACLLAVCAAFPDLDKRIVNGERASLYEFPSIASLQLQYSSGFYHICGAIVLSQTKILTAAHCTYNSNARDLRIVVGLLTQGQTTPYTQIRSVASYKNHPSFRNSAWRGFPDDIAVITLSSPIQYNSYVQPAKLPAQGTSFAGSECVMAGWGRTEGGGPAAQDLKKASITKIENSQCSRLWGTITNTQMCVFEQDSSGKNVPTACQGDSGGPLYCGSNFEYVAGLTSWGEGDCTGRYPAVYTRISEYRSWISQQ